MALTFNSTFYYANRPDVLEAYLNSDLSVSAYDFALNHYNTFGWKEGANPNEVFNTNEYLDANPDVEIAGVNPFDHYNNNGQSEGRAPNATFPSLAEFDAETYLAMNPDLGIAGITTAAAAYDHYITFGYAENRPGAPDNADFQLAGALDALQGARDAYSDFQEDLDPTLDGDGDGVVDRSELEDNLEAAEIALGAAPTERALNSALSAAQAAVNAETGLAAAVNNMNSRAVQLEAELASQIEADASVAAELAGFNVRNNSTATLDLTASDILVDGATVILTRNADGDVVLAPTAPASYAGYAELIVDVQAAYDASIAVSDAVAALDAAVAGVIAAENGTYDNTETYYTTTGGEVNFTTAGEFGTQADLASNLLDAQAAIQNRADLVAAVADAQALYNQGVALEDAVEAAEDAIEALGYEVPVEVPATGSLAATADSDIYLYNDPASGLLNSSITGFGAAGNDLLFIGDGFTQVNLGLSVNLATSNQGNAGALEFFVQQQGANAVLYIEDDNFDGSLSTGWDGNTITLVGVDASSIVYENGAIRIVDAIA